MVRRVLCALVVVASLGGCALVEDRDAQVASGPPSSDTGAGPSGTSGSAPAGAGAPGRPGGFSDPATDGGAVGGLGTGEPGADGGPGAATGAGAGGAPDGGPGSGSGLALATDGAGSPPVPPGTGPGTTGTGPGTTGTGPGTTGTGGPPPSITPPGGFDAYPPFCLDLRRLVDTSVEMFSLSTTAEVVTRLQSMRSILSSIESTGGAEIGADARVVGDGLDQLVGRLDPSVAVPEAYRALLLVVGGLAPAPDRLISRGLGLCGGSDDPVLSAQDGITALGGVR